MVRAAGPAVLDTLVVFGASGDLVSRYILPSLAQLLDSAELPKSFRLLGVARDEWDRQRFQNHARAALARHAPTVASDSQESLVTALDYLQGDVTNPEDLRPALAGLKVPYAVYLALPPFLFEPAIMALSQTDIPAGSRLVVEKPFGEDAASARRLNALLHRCFREDAVFRMDHFLALETVQNILGLRFGNRLFEPLWNCQHVERVEITWDEALTIEGRASYDRVGALRDMVQNHLLQILTLMAMEPPVALNEHDLRDRKLDVLRGIRTFGDDEVRRYTRRARYTAGRIGQRDVPDYTSEPGVERDRETETFAAITLFVDNWRWAAVPFTLRSGKALGRDRQEVRLYFHRVPHMLFPHEQEPPQNDLRIRLDDNTMTLRTNTTTPSGGLSLTSLELTGPLAPGRRSPYGRLLLDLLEGNPMLFIRDDEAEESWRIVDPIVNSWAGGAVPLLEYPAGSDGPA